jgi:hypothetical protein
MFCVQETFRENASPIAPIRFSADLEPNGIGELAVVATADHIQVSE